MITLDELATIFAGRLSQEECFQECYDAILSNSVQPVGEWSGRHRASNFLANYRIKEGTIQEAGISTLGFETTLQNLEARPPNERLLQWRLEAPDRVFDVFIAEASKELVGCIRVIKRPLSPLEELTKFLQDQNEQHAWHERQEERCSFVLYQLLVLKVIRPVGVNPTIVNGSEAPDMCLLQQRRVLKNGLPALGFERTLQNLRGRAPDEKLVRWVLEELPNYSVKARDTLFLLFISEDRQEVIGCVSIKRRLEDS